MSTQLNLNLKPDYDDITKEEEFDSFEDASHWLRGYLNDSLKVRYATIEGWPTGFSNMAKTPELNWTATFSGVAKINS